jgi:glycosyltransferase involved in cell wall biosynthesis
MPNFLVSVVIPVKDDVEVFRLITQLKSQPNDRAEIIVVANGADVIFVNRLRQLISQTKNFTLLKLSKANIPLARNEGVKKAQGSFVLFLDSDCVVSAGYLARVTKYLKTANNRLIARGDVKFIPRSSWFSRLNSKMRDRSYNRHRLCYTPNLLIAMPMFDKIGDFLAKSHYSEDVEWGQRAKLYGWEIEILPKRLSVSHIDDSHPLKTIRTWFYYGLGRAFRQKRTHILKKSSQLSYFRSMFVGSRLIDKNDSADFVFFVCLHYFVRTAGVVFGTLVTWRRSGHGVRTNLLSKSPN